MDEAGLCDKVALIQNGKILSVNTPQGVVDNFSKPLWAVKSTKMLQLLNELLQKDFVEDVYPFGEFHHVVMKDRSGEPMLRQFIAEHNNENAVLQATKPDIEDCFIALMKN
jgi:ABC-type multidrug transport system ATPase subunit